MPYRRTQGSSCTVNRGIYTYAATVPGRTDDHRQHAAYAQGRALREAAMTTWMHVFAAHAPARRPLTVAGLGSGTGRSPQLPRYSAGPVYGVESSARMRAVAEQAAGHPAVIYLDGRAGQIPLAARPWWPAVQPR